MDIVQDLDRQAWQDFVNQHPDSQIFHTPEMFEVFSHTRGYRPTLWAAVNSHRYPLALLLPVEISLSGGLLRRFTTRAVAYGSVLCTPGTEGERALRRLLEAYKQATGGQFLFTELRNLVDLKPYQRVLNDSGFKFEEHLNFLVDLNRPEEEIWSDIRSNAQRNVRKAAKLDVEIEDVDDPHRVPDVYALLKEVYNRIQVPLADLSFFLSSYEILHPKGMMKMLVSRAENADIGALTLLLHKDIILYWYTGTLREYSSYRAGDALVWHALKWGTQNGFRTLDFGGAGKPDEEYGVRDFKAKFGGTLVNYGRNVCVHAPLALQASKAVYSVARRLIR
jgi:serine/alanine adding enzyme